MKIKLFLSLALSLILLKSAFAQEFPIGIWFVGNQNGLNQVDSMGFTWIQAYGGWDLSNTANFSHILQNNRNLKVIATLERNILLPSFGQRMQFQAEEDIDPTGKLNYFKQHTTGSPGVHPGTGKDVWLADTSNHSAGFMVQSPVPDSLYFHERCDWVATATISIDPTGNATDQVVRIEIAEGGNIFAQRIITEGEFGGSTAFKSFELPYTLPAPAPPPPPLSLPVIATVAEAQETFRHIDVRVYWYDQVNTYLDQVVLEDSVNNAANPEKSGAYQLFRGKRDSLIDNDASHFKKFLLTLQKNELSS
jgi:hypothetical protein